MKHMPSGKRTSKSNASSTNKNKPRIPSLSSPQLRFVVCVKSGGYVDLEPLKVYKVLADRDARTHGMLRIVDSSGDDYLFPADFFRPVQVTTKLFQLVAGAVKPMTANELPSEHFRDDDEEDANVRLVYWLLAEITPERLGRRDKLKEIRAMAKYAKPKCNEV